MLADHRSDRERWTLVMIQVLISLTMIGVGTEKPLKRASDDDFRGVWYANQPIKGEYRFKYSGGKATYPQQQLPTAFHFPAARKTFFVYGRNAQACICSSFERMGNKPHTGKS